MAARTLVRRTSLRLSHSRKRASGQALIVLVFMVSIAAMLLVYGTSTEVGRAAKADQRTRAALDYAREALIGRAVGDASRPGSLPCPDTDDDGSAELFVGSACPSYIGRLPWRTLGIAEVRDETGERLWYALSPPFRDHPSAPDLNSDTRGTLTVYSGSEATVITREAVAVVFAAGAALGSQVRDEAFTQCSTTGKHVPRRLCAANYLDSGGGQSNSAAAGPYIAGATGSAFNDRLGIVITADFMPLVEQRVAVELRNALIAYKQASTCACYPWPAGGADGASDRGLGHGRVPTSGVLPQPWPSGVLPAYFQANQWGRVVHYAVARSALEDGGRRCDTCIDAELSIDGARGFELVLITPGFAERVRTTSADYIDDAENRDADDRYVTPRSHAASRDRLYAITSAP